MGKMPARNSGQSDLRQAIASFLQGMPTDAPIRALTASPAIERRLEAFDRADSRALKKQKPYRRANGIALSLGFTAAIAWAILLFPLETSLPEHSLRLVGAVRGTCLVLAFLALGWIRWGGSLVKWREARSRAEKLRGQVFRKLIADGAKDGTALPQALSCFEAAHLERQLDFFKGRIDQQSDAERRSKKHPYKRLARVLTAAVWVFGAIAIVNICAAFGYVVPNIPGPLHVSHVQQWEAGLTALASSMLAYLSARASMDRAALVAAMYRLAAADLMQLKRGRLARVRAAAAEGNAQLVSEFVEQVQAALDREHRVWKVLADPNV
jgi:hypothetical protein